MFYNLTIRNLHSIWVLWVHYTTFTNFNMKYLVMCKVYTDVCGIKQLYHVCPPVRKIIHSLKLVDYLHVQADNPWYNYYLSFFPKCLQFLSAASSFLQVTCMNKLDWNWAAAWDFQQFDTLTSVDSDEPL